MDFSLEAFCLLESQISNLAAEHFQAPPARVPREVKEMIPPGMPPFFDNTKSATHIRAAYVKHHISSILTRYIFQPFLFVLEPRLAPADRLFREMSEELKRKSTKREALWRQRTLYAAFTASSAKQTINKVATRVVDEVMRTVKYLTLDTRWSPLIVAIRRIVKQAAETWRYARLELGLISASMDGKDIVRASTKGAGVYVRNVAGVEELCEKVLLPLFPVIKRDPMIGDLLGKPDLKDEGYIFSPGQLLYSDDTDVVACREGVFRYIARSTQPRMSTFPNPKLSKTHGQEIHGKLSGESTIHGPQSRTQDRQEGVDIIHVSPTSRTESRTRSHQEEGEGEEEEDLSRDSSIRRTESEEQDDRIEDNDSPPRSPTRSQGTPAPEDRVTPSPVNLQLDNRTQLSPEAEALGKRHKAERDSRTPTHVQEHRARVATPDDGPAASDHSIISSRLSVQSPTTEASQHSRQSMKGTGTAPSWENTGGEVAAFQAVGDGW